MRTVPGRMVLPALLVVLALAPLAAGPPLFPEEGKPLLSSSEDEAVLSLESDSGIGLCFLFFYLRSSRVL